jgi:hypothetical protein
VPKSLKISAQIRLRVDKYESNPLPLDVLNDWDVVKKFEGKAGRSYLLYPGVSTKESLDLASLKLFCTIRLQTI